MVVDHLTKQPGTCPGQKFVITGYSQGASVLRKAGPKIPEASLQKVIAMVTFGDPGKLLKKPQLAAELDRKKRTFVD